MGTKLLLTLIGTALLTGAGVVFAFVLHTDSAALWGLWFGGLSVIIGQYSAANVAINGHASKHYEPRIAGDQAATGPPA